MFTPTLGQTYYAVGPLQKNGIGKWTYTGDCYDRSRILLGNVFTTTNDAAEARDKIQTLLKDNNETC